MHASGLGQVLRPSLTKAHPFSKNDILVSQERPRDLMDSTGFERS